MFSDKSELPKLTENSDDTVVKAVCTGIMEQSSNATDAFLEYSDLNRLKKAEGCLLVAKRNLQRLASESKDLQQSVMQSERELLV